MQFWIAIAAHLLIAIVKKRLHLFHRLYEILQTLSLTMFETTPIDHTPPSENSDAENERRQAVREALEEIDAWRVTILRSSKYLNIWLKLVA